MRAMVALVLHLGGVGKCVRLIWEWMDRLCKGLSIPRNQGIYRDWGLCFSPVLFQCRCVRAMLQFVGHFVLV